jgi:uncharacterized protein YcbK (DUF882 family)
MSRRIALFAAVLLMLGLAGTASAKKKDREKEQDKKHTKVKVCTEREVKVGSGKKARTRTKRTCKRVPQFDGHNASKTALRTEPLERPSGEIWVRSENLQEEVQVNIYRADGSFDEAALAQLDEIFRCRRSNEVRAVDPRLYEHMSRVFDHFGKQRIELVSGFRFKERNSSRHWHASAMDIRIKGVTIRELYEFAETLDLGGMGVGIYPNSGFVHIDYRAPGEPSYRWTDWSYPDGEGKATSKRKGKEPKRRTTRAKRPTS